MADKGRFIQKKKRELIFIKVETYCEKGLLLKNKDSSFFEKTLLFMEENRAYLVQSKIVKGSIGKGCRRFSKNTTIIDEVAFTKFYNLFD